MPNETASNRLDDRLIFSSLHFVFFSPRAVFFRSSEHLAAVSQRGNRRPKGNCQTIRSRWTFMTCPSDSIQFHSDSGISQLPSGPPIRFRSQMASSRRVPSICPPLRIALSGRRSPISERMNYYFCHTRLFSIERAAGRERRPLITSRRRASANRFSTECSRR